MPKPPEKTRAPRRRAAKAGSPSILRPTGLTSSSASTLATQLTPAASAAAVSPSSSAVTASAVGAAAAIDSGAIMGHLPPGIFAIKSLTSLFDPARAGKAVVRPNDLLALRIELVNMQVRLAQILGQTLDCRIHRLRDLLARHQRLGRLAVA